MVPVSAARLDRRCAGSAFGVKGGGEAGDAGGGEKGQEREKDKEQKREKIYQEIQRHTTKRHRLSRGPCL
jgi:hypothetical protein